MYTLHPSPLQLITVLPPTYWVLGFPFCFFLVGIFLVLRRIAWRPRSASGNAFSAFDSYRTAPVQPNILNAVGGSLLMLLSAAVFAFLAQPTRLVLNRSANTWALNSGTFLFYPLAETGSLSTLKGATVRSKGLQQELLLVFQDNSYIPVNAWTVQPGQEEAADQINTFLASQSHPVRLMKNGSTNN